MTNKPRQCIKQFDSENGQAWLGTAFFAAFTVGFAIRCTWWPHGWLSRMAIGAGIISMMFQIGQVIPGACCLRICENGLVIRTLFSGHFIQWEDILDVSVQPSTPGDRVTLHLNPKLGLGRTMPMFFTYRMPPDTLAEELRTYLSPGGVAETEDPQEISTETAG